MSSGPSSATTCCVTLGISLNLSEPWFPSVTRKVRVLALAFSFRSLWRGSGTLISSSRAEKHLFQCPLIKFNDNFPFDTEAGESVCVNEVVNRGQDSIYCSASNHSWRFGQGRA